VYRVVTNLAVLDFGTTERSMALVSTHPGVTVGEVVDATGSPLDTSETEQTRPPSGEERSVIEELDPEGRRHREVPS